MSKDFVEFYANEVQCIKDAILMFDQDLFEFGIDGIPRKVEHFASSAAAKMRYFEINDDDSMEEFPLNNNELIASYFALMYTLDRLDEIKADNENPDDYLDDSLQDTDFISSLVNKIKTFLSECNIKFV